MNGVRRLFSSSSTSTTSPTSTLPTTIVEATSPPASQPTSILKERLVQSPDPLASPPRQRPKETTTSTQHKQDSVFSAPRGNSAFRTSAPNVRDELLMGLLASEVVIECNDFRTLSSDEVQALKQEQRLLALRLEAVSKKLKLETKLRDAAVSLNRVKLQNRQKGSDASGPEVESANRKLDLVQKDLFQITDRANEVSRKLLEHNASILSATLRNLTPRPPDISANNSGNNSPTSTSSRTNSLARFGAANFYAGHANAASPMTAKALERQLKELSSMLEVAKKKETDLVREVQHLELEKNERETRLSMELQAAEERISSMKAEASRVAGLEGQVAQLMEEREESQSALTESQARFQDRLARIKDLESQLETLAGQGSASTAQLVKERNARAAELESQLADHRMVEARLADEQRNWEKERHELELSRAEEVAKLEGELSERRDELEEGLEKLMAIFVAHNISVASTPTNIMRTSEILESYVEEMATRLQRLQASKDVLEEEVKNGDVALDTANQTIAALNGEKAVLQRQLREVEAKLKEPPSGANDVVEGDKNVMFQLKSLWSILPSPEARAIKTGGRSPTKASVSPLASPSTPGPSLSELDVRALRALYDSKASSMPATSASDFTVDSFVKRIQSLVADDRALIERLIRFAQSHDLLKANAERAQRLARDSSVALETYQKQVKALQDRNDNLDNLQSTLNMQLREMQDALDGSKDEMTRMEARVHEQSEQVVSLMEANNALSAKTLTLAAEPEAVRLRMEGQISQLRQQLTKAEGEVDAMQMSEQTQRVALLDELNSMQTENSQLREQLRAERAKR